MIPLCVTPVFIQVRGIETGIPCRKCWQCKANRIRDWTGRCIAESKHAVAANVVTLTYGEHDRYGRAQDLNALVLTPKDIQDYFKRLRKSGYPCRFLVAGEYGSQKERAHWHAVIFWTERQPNYSHRINTMEHTQWGNGYTFWDDFTPEGAAYVCKYMLKAEDDEAAQYYFSMSKKPELGNEYFRDLAKKWVEAGLMPQQPRYWFPEVKDKETGLPREFHMRGAPADTFCREFFAAWERRYGYDPFKFQHSDFLLAYLDREAIPLASEQIERRGYVKHPHSHYIPDDAVVVFNERLNVFELNTSDGEVLYWSFNEKGERAWMPGQDGVVAPSIAKSLATTYAKQNSPEEYRRQSKGAF